MKCSLHDSLQYTRGTYVYETIGRIIINKMLLFLPIKKRKKKKQEEEEE